jgi:pyruvate/2-oxoglutarate/acetoin dehydrogenase E1 component
MQVLDNVFNFKEKKMKYFEELKKSMDWLGHRDNTVFIGQAVSFPGTAMSTTLKDVDKKKLIELPVAEEMQMGMSLGMALDGTVPISIYPRWNFLLCGMNQLINHIDKLKSMTTSDNKSKIIIRTGIGSERPLHPQDQHVGDFTDQIQGMCKTIQIVRLNEPSEIFPAYQLAYDRQDGVSTILVEYGDYYSEK